MSLSEERQLASVTINLSAKTIDVLWMDQVMKNGLVISETPHRGAYPVNDDGEPDSTVVSDMGKTISDILGEALANSQESLVIVNNTLSERNSVIQEYTDEITRLQGLVKVMEGGSAELQRQVQEIDEQFQAASGKATELQTEWEAAQNEIASLRAQLSEFQLMANGNKPSPEEPENAGTE